MSDVLVVKNPPTRKGIYQANFILKKPMSRTAIKAKLANKEIPSKLKEYTFGSFLMPDGAGKMVSVTGPKFHRDLTQCFQSGKSPSQCGSLSNVAFKPGVYMMYGLTKRKLVTELQAYCILEKDLEMPAGITQIKELHISRDTGELIEYVDQDGIHHMLKGGPTGALPALVPLLGKIGAFLLASATMAWGLMAWAGVLSVAYIAFNALFYAKKAIDWALETIGLKSKGKKTGLGTYALAVAIIYLAWKWLTAKSPGQHSPLAPDNVWQPVRAKIHQFTEPQKAIEPAKSTGE